MNFRTHTTTALLLGTAVAGKFIQYRYGQEIGDQNILSLIAQSGAIALATFTGGWIPDLDYTATGFKESSPVEYYRQSNPWRIRSSSNEIEECILTITKPPFSYLTDTQESNIMQMFYIADEKEERGLHFCPAPNERLRLWDGLFDHRQELHTLVNAIGSALPFLLIYGILSIFGLKLPWLLAMGAGMSLGCIWHMIIDTFTPQGIMWLYPLTRKRFSIPLVRSGKTESDKTNEVKNDRSAHSKEIVFYIIAALTWLFLSANIWTDIVLAVLK